MLYWLTFKSSNSKDLEKKKKKKFWLKTRIKIKGNHIRIFVNSDK